MKLLINNGGGSLTLEKFINLIDREEIVILLAGKRDVLPADVEKIKQLGHILAQRTKKTLFRSGGAHGADTLFKEGIIEAGASNRFQAVIPFAKKNQPGYEQIALDEHMIANEKRVIFQSKKIKSGLVEGYLNGKDPKNRGAYLLRDAVMVLGSENMNLKEASFAIFYDDLTNVKDGGTGFTMRVCDNNGVNYIDQRIWGRWLP
jgi:hypothetical protein